jgi:hypothetical protein
MSAWSDIPGWTDEHLLGLYDWAVERAPTDRVSLFVEIGVAFGRSYAYAATKVRASGKPVALMGFDPWIVPAWLAPEHRAIVDEHGGFEAACRHFLLGFLGGRCNPPLGVASVPAAKMLPGIGFAGCDFVFIDADHTYESLLADLRAWWPLVRSGGAIAGHDHTPNFPGIERACREFFGDDGYESIGTCFRKVKP